MNLPRIDQNTEQGQALQKVVQTQLKDYLGTDYSDDVLPLYIVVMLAHGNKQELVAENLEAFLGANDANQFAKWYATIPEVTCIECVIPDIEKCLKETTGVAVYDDAASCRLFGHLAEHGYKYAAPEPEPVPDVEAEVGAEMHKERFCLPIECQQPSRQFDVLADSAWLESVT
jgi:hypothetical protein